LSANKDAQYSEQKQPFLINTVNKKRKVEFPKTAKFGNRDNQNPSSIPTKKPQNIKTSRILSESGANTQNDGNNYMPTTNENPMYSEPLAKNSLPRKSQRRDSWC